MRIAIIGQGGHSKVVRDVIHSMGGIEIAACLDDRFKEKFFHEQVFYGPSASAVELFNDFSDIKFIVAVGSNHARKQIVSRLGFTEDCYATLVHPSAQISPSCFIGYGSVVMPGAVVNADARIGNHAIINTCAVVEHDSMIEDFAHISPNATLTGNVTVKEGTQIGAGATIIPGRVIGQWSMVGAGAAVIDDIPSNCTVVGVPARVKVKEATGGG